jgi:hypothetical protein
MGHAGNIQGVGEVSRSRSRTLGLDYVYDRGKITFEDGVEYTIEEAMRVSIGGCEGDDLRKLHLVKKIFNGEIIQASRAGARTSQAGARTSSTKKEKEEDMPQNRRWGVLKCECGSGDFYICKVGPHMGVYCITCEKWHGWMQKSLAIRLTRLNPKYTMRSEKIVQQSLDLDEHDNVVLYEEEGTCTSRDS